MDARPLSLLALAALCALPWPGHAAPTAEQSAVTAKTALADGIAWHLATPRSADGKTTLKPSGGVKLGVELSGAEREASLARGGDGVVAEFTGGMLSAPDEPRLSLPGSAMTLLLRFKYTGEKWQDGELFCKHGGHSKLVYNLYVNQGKLGFEYGAEGTTGLAGSVTLGTDKIAPGKWHDLVVRYDGNTLVMYLDGLVVSRTKGKGELRKGNTEPLQLGRRLLGQMDTAALWPRALSDVEVLALSGGEAALEGKREALSKAIEAKIGREGLTLADSARGTRELRAKLYADPHRPRYHLMPPEGFWNDINGTIYWKGRYHVFFLGRSAPDKETILSGKDSDHNRETWLHASSTDLVHWLHHPPALSPVFDGSMPQGIYSGDAINDAPVPTLVFHVPGQGTCIATAEDDELIKWKMSPKNPVIPAATAPPEVSVFDTSAWREGEWYYLLVGNKNKRPGYEGDSSSLFKSKDLEHWDYRGPFYKSDRKWTTVDEDCACPDFFPLGSKHMLVMHTHRPYSQAQYYLGRWDAQQEQFFPEQHGKFNSPGGQLAAPETLVDAQGRRIFWAWVREQKNNQNGWGSVACLPRVFTLGEDGTLRQAPPKELETLRRNGQTKANVALAAEGETVLEGIAGDGLELNLTIEPGSAKEVGVKVRRSPDGAEETAIVYNPADGTLRTELAKSAADGSVTYWTVDGKWADAHNVPPAERRTQQQVAPFKVPAGEPLRLRVFVDRSIIDVFANERQAMTQRIYPSRPDSLGVSLFARGGTAQATRVEAWEVQATNSW